MMNKVGVIVIVCLFVIGAFRFWDTMMYVYRKRNKND